MNDPRNELADLLADVLALAQDSALRQEEAVPRAANAAYSSSRSA